MTRNSVSHARAPHAGIHAIAPHAAFKSTMTETYDISHGWNHRPRITSKRFQFQRAPSV